MKILQNIFNNFHADIFLECGSLFKLRNIPSFVDKPIEVVPRNPNGRHVFIWGRFSRVQVVYL